MKIKNIAAVLLLIWTCGFSSVVSAAEIQTVQLTEENQLVYTKIRQSLPVLLMAWHPETAGPLSLKLRIKTVIRHLFYFAEDNGCFGRSRKSVWRSI